MNSASSSSGSAVFCRASARLKSMRAGSTSGLKVATATYSPGSRIAIKNARYLSTRTKLA